MVPNLGTDEALMRAFLIAAVLLSFASAAGEDLNARAHPMRLPLDGQRGPYFAGRLVSTAPKDTVIGDRIGVWLGVTAGRWDLFDDGSPSDKGSPTLAGTIRKGAAEIQVVWHPDE